MKKEIVAGIEYTRPYVVLMNHSGLGVAEYGARSAYDSFNSSENEIVKIVHDKVDLECISEPELDVLNHIEHSDLLDNLAWTFFHHSVLEHANVQYLIKGTSRACLQEHARHRIQSLTVRSTRYTMSPVLYAFLASTLFVYNKLSIAKSRLDMFTEYLLNLDLFVTSDEAYNKLEIRNIYDKLTYQLKLIGIEAMCKLILAKDNLAFINHVLELSKTILDDVNYSYDKEPTTPNISFSYIIKILQQGKNKRNSGDSFKHIITDNWKVDMVVSMNLRGLKNYISLRDSNSAFFQIRWLAQAMIDVTPDKYLNLIVKNKKIKADLE